MRAVRHELLDLGVGPENVLGIARQRSPAERPDSAAEQRADIGRHETWEIEGVLDAFFERHLPNVVAVVDGRYAGVRIGQHRAHMFAHRRFGRALDSLGIARAPLLPLLQAPTLGQIAVDRIVCGSLVGDDVGPDAAAQKFRQDLARVAEQRDRDGLALLGRPFDDRERVVEVLRLHVDIAGAQPELDAGRTALDGKQRSARHRGGKRLGAAHPAEAGGKDPSPPKVAAIVPAPHLDEGLVGALHDALRADIDP